MKIILVFGNCHILLIKNSIINQNINKLQVLDDKPAIGKNKDENIKNNNLNIYYANARSRNIRNKIHFWHFYPILINMTLYV